jgi:hypothetical protein
MRHKPQDVVVLELKIIRIQPIEIFRILLKTRRGNRAFTYDLIGRLTLNLLFPQDLNSRIREPSRY